MAERQAQVPHPLTHDAPESPVHTRCRNTIDLDRFRHLHQRAPPPRPHVHDTGLGHIVEPVTLPLLHPVCVIGCVGIKNKIRNCRFFSPDPAHCLFACFSWMGWNVRAMILLRWYLCCSLPAHECVETRKGSLEKDYRKQIFCSNSSYKVSNFRHLRPSRCALRLQSRLSLHPYSL
jgi:hypothetical protein